MVSPMPEDSLGACANSNSTPRSRQSAKYRDDGQGVCLWLWGNATCEGWEGINRHITELMPKSVPISFCNPIIAEDSAEVCSIYHMLPLYSGVPNQARNIKTKAAVSPQHLTCAHSKRWTVAVGFRELPFQTSERGNLDSLVKIKTFPGYGSYHDSNLSSGLETRHAITC